MTTSQIPSSLKELEAEQERLAQMQVEIDERKAVLDQVRPQLEHMSATHRLAIALHDKLCSWNHTDMCGWFYAVKQGGVHDWSESSHRKYLAKARQIMNRLSQQPVTCDNIEDFLALL